MDDTIEVNGTTYYAHTPTAPTDSDMQIVVLQRGWVFIGRPESEGDTVTLHDARCIRRWGTTNGLAELVNGPKPDTEVEPPSQIRYHQSAEVFTMAVNEGAWK